MTGAAVYVIVGTDTVQAALKTKAQGNFNDLYSKLNPASAISTYVDLNARLNGMDTAITAAGTAGAAYVVPRTDAARLAVASPTHGSLCPTSDSGLCYWYDSGGWNEFMDCQHTQTVLGEKTFSSACTFSSGVTAYVTDSTVTANRMAGWNSAKKLISNPTQWTNEHNATGGHDKQFRRSRLGYKDADEFYLGGACYFHASGTTAQTVYWTDQITYQVSSAGSNSGSDDPHSGKCYWVYVDDSAVVSAATNQLTASEFLFTSAAPTYNHSYGQWYRGKDLAVAYVFTKPNSTSLHPFKHDGGEYIEFNSARVSIDTNARDIDTDWLGVTLDGPSVTNAKVQATFHSTFDTAAATNVFWRTSGDTSNGDILYYNASTATRNSLSRPVYLSNGNQGQMKHGASNASTSTAYTNGYYLLGGM